MKKNIILLILAAGAFSFKAEAASAGQPETILASFQPRQRQQIPEQAAWHAHAAAELAEQNLCRKLTTPMEWEVLKNAPSGEDLGQAVESAIPMMVELASEKVRQTDLAANQAAQQAYLADQALDQALSVPEVADQVLDQAYRAYLAAWQAAYQALDQARHDLEKINKAQQTWDEVRGIIAMRIAHRLITQQEEDALVSNAIREIDLVDVD